MSNLKSFMALQTQIDQCRHDIQRLQIQGTPYALNLADYYQEKLASLGRRRNEIIDQIRRQP